MVNNIIEYGSSWSPQLNPIYLHNNHDILSFLPVDLRELDDGDQHVGVKIRKIAKHLWLQASLSGEAMTSPARVAGILPNIKVS